MNNPRYLAFQSLLRCESGSRYSNLEINAVLDKNPLSQADKGLYTALVYSVLEREMLLDYLLKDYLKMPIERLDREVRVALRLGAVQLYFFDKLPDHAVCDETVELIKSTKKRSATGLVNAVLRSLARDKVKNTEKIAAAPLNIRYSMPEWIVDLWMKDYGEERALAILEGFSKKPPLTLRVNTLKTTPEELYRAFKDKNIQCEVKGDMIVLDTGVDPERLYGFDEGLFFVQGTASALAVKSLAPTPESVVVDTCACPGGKSFAAALSLENKGKIYSFDLHKSKLGLIEKGAERLGISIIEVEPHDARESFGKLEGRADYVICDVPCSGLGVISKKPDIRSKKREDIERLPEIQYAILENSVRLLKNGGRLLYSTCTLNKEENERVTDRLLKAYPELERAEGYPVTYFPDGESEDGFFTDIIVRK